MCVCLCAAVLLARDMPAAHDFYVSLLPGGVGGLTAGAEVLPPDWRQPVTYDRCVYDRFLWYATVPTMFSWKSFAVVPQLS